MAGQGGTQEHGRWRLGARGLLTGWMPPISGPSWTLTGRVWPSCGLPVPGNLGVGTVMIKRANPRLRPGGGVGGGEVSVQALTGRVRRSWSWNPPQWLQSALCFLSVPTPALGAGGWRLGSPELWEGPSPLLPFHFPCAVAEAWALPPGSRQVPRESFPVCP